MLGLTAPAALLVRAQALYDTGQFEHALLSFHRAARQTGAVLMAEREQIQEGIRQAEQVQ